MCLLKRSSLNTLLIPKFIMDTIDYYLDLLSYSSGSKCACNFNRSRANPI